MRRYEEEFARRLRALDADSRACAVHAYTELAIHHIAGANHDLVRTLNLHAGFWNSVVGSLQASSFVALGRIYDRDSGNDTAEEVLRYATQYRGLFARPALEARKIRAGLHAEDASKYAAAAPQFDPSTLRPLHDELDAVLALYRENAERIRHTVFAHRGRIDIEHRETMFNGLMVRDYQRLVVFPLRLYRALRMLYDDGTVPELDTLGTDTGLLLQQELEKGTSSWEHLHAAKDTEAFLRWLQARASSQEATSEAPKRPTWPGKLEALPHGLRRAAILEAAQRRGLKTPRK